MLVDVDILNDAPFDWCFNCAKFHCADNNIKMFAYIFLSLMKSLPKKEYQFDNTFSKDDRVNGFKFSIRLSNILDNDAIRPFLFKKKTWKKWLHALIREHIFLYDKNITESTIKTITEPAKIIISDDRIEVIYVYKD